MELKISLRENLKYNMSILWNLWFQFYKMNFRFSIFENNKIPTNMLSILSFNKKIIIISFACGKKKTKIFLIN